MRQGAAEVGHTGRRRWGWSHAARIAVAVASITLAALSIWRIEAVSAPLQVERFSIGTTPVTLRTLPEAGPGPVVVIAHGFAGSRQLMAPFAVTLARAGYTTLSFDFPGHGRNPVPMTGDVRAEDGATRALLAALTGVIAAARDLPGSDGQVALLGHSMAADIIVRAAIAQPDLAATIAVSMFSPAVTASAPGNLLMIVGAWEAPLVEEARRVLRLSAGPEALVGTRYGDPVQGTARMLVVAPSVEHVGVLYSGASLAAAQAWLDGVFGTERPYRPDLRGPWVLALLAGVVALGWPLARLLPRVRPPRMSPVARPWLAVLGPAIATPLILWPLPTDLLPVLVADYLAAHFALYGLLLGGMLYAQGVWRPGLPDARVLAAGLGAGLFCILGPGIALDSYVANFLPHAGRVPVIAALALGTVLFTLAEEALIRAPARPIPGPGLAPRPIPGPGPRPSSDPGSGRWWVGAASKAAFVLSLIAAIMLDFQGLFFLIIILPVIVLFFLVYGLLDRWIHGQTQHPVAAGLALGAAFAWALGVTFPLAG
ncbi:MAG: alpha/beta fold hydrolase [Pseudomonadota bacterium]